MDYIYQVEIYHSHRLLGRFMTGNNFPEKDLAEFIQLLDGKEKHIKIYKATKKFIKRRMKKEYFLLKMV